jgi:hypothetical protein
MRTERNQVASGSCYTVSFFHEVEVRLNLKYGKQTPVLSP